MVVNNTWMPYAMRCCLEWIYSRVSASRLGLQSLFEIRNNFVENRGRFVAGGHLWICWLQGPSQEEPEWSGVHFCKNKFVRVLSQWVVVNPMMQACMEANAKYRCPVSPLLQTVTVPTPANTGM